MPLSSSIGVSPGEYMILIVSSRHELRLPRHKKNSSSEIQRILFFILTFFLDHRFPDITSTNFCITQWVIQWALWVLLDCDRGSITSGHFYPH